MSKIRGGRLMVFLGGVASGTSISYATNHTLTINADLTDTSNKDEGNAANGSTWQSQESNILSWEASTENLYSTDGQGKNFADLYDYMIAGTPVELVLGLATNDVADVPTGGWGIKTSDIYYKGNALVSNLQLNAPMGDEASYTASFTGVGKLNKITA